jgi:hypothetical protein
MRLVDSLSGREGSVTTATDQARDLAHLVHLRTCADCGRPATFQLFNGLNAPFGVYCSMHAPVALRRFKAGQR